MPKRDELAAWLAALPDADVEALWAVAARLRVTMAPASGPDLAAILEAAPVDDEPWTEVDEAATAAALDDVANGRVHSAADVRRMLAL